MCSIFFCADSSQHFRDAGPFPLRCPSPPDPTLPSLHQLLDTCARTGGARFQAELGKFRFLNELIKLLSPRYLGARTPQRVKQRVADLLLLWSRQIPHETKIQEAFTLLQKQGLLDLHGVGWRECVVLGSGATSGQSSGGATSGQNGGEGGR